MVRIGPAAQLPADSRYKTLLFAVMMFNS